MFVTRKTFAVCVALHFLRALKRYHELRPLYSSSIFSAYQYVGQAQHVPDLSQ